MQKISKEATSETLKVRIRKIEMIKMEKEVKTTKHKKVKKAQKLKEKVLLRLPKEKMLLRYNLNPKRKRT